MKKAVALPAAGVVLVFLVALSEVPRVLVFGSLPFLARVLPRLSVNWATVGVAGAALILFGAGVHAVGRASYRPLPPEEGPARQGWKVRWSLALVAGVFLLFAAGICMVGITHQVVWLLTDPEPLVGSTLKQRYGGTTSQTNLKGIGIAVQAYQSTYEVYPPGGTFRADGSMLHSWETRLLPFIGYSVEQIHFERPWNDPRNQPAFQSVIPQFINPDFRTVDLVDADGYGLSHYAANGRVLAANRSVKFADLPGGASGTLLVGEVNANFKPWGNPANWREPARGINRSPDGFGGPQGSGGAQVLMADGSVRFLSDRTSPAVLRALSGPGGPTEVDGAISEPPE